MVLISKRFKVRPSEILEIEDAYTAYCFDEACIYILSKVEDGKEPNFKKFDKDGKVKVKNYKTASEMYKDMGYDVGSYVKVSE